MICRYVKVLPEMAIQLVEVTDTPLTIIYPEVSGLAQNVIAEDKTAGIRIPQNDFCIQLIKKFRKPIVSTSANISGETAPITLAEIKEEIKAAVDWIAKPNLEGKATHKASSIIKVGVENEIEIIRK